MKRTAKEADLARMAVNVKAALEKTLHDLIFLEMLSGFGAGDAKSFGPYSATGMDYDFGRLRDHPRFGRLWENAQFETYIRIRVHDGRTVAKGTRLIAEAYEGTRDGVVMSDHINHIESYANRVYNSWNLGKSMN